VLDIEEEIGNISSKSYWTKLLDRHSSGFYGRTMEIIRLVLKIFDWCTRISGKFFKKSHAVDGKFQGLVVQAPRNR
jgi:hypothetical protein